MSNVNQVPQWLDAINQIEKGEQIIGGYVGDVFNNNNSNLNLATQQLADITLWLAQEYNKSISKLNEILNQSNPTPVVTTPTPSNQTNPTTNAPATTKAPPMLSITNLTNGSTTSKLLAYSESGASRNLLHITCSEPLSGQVVIRMTQHSDPKATSLKWVGGQRTFTGMMKDGFVDILVVNSGDEELGRLEDITVILDGVNSLSETWTYNYKYKIPTQVPTNPVFSSAVITADKPPTIGSVTTYRITTSPPNSGSRRLDVTLYGIGPMESGVGGNTNMVAKGADAMVNIVNGVGTVTITTPTTTIISGLTITATLWATQEDTTPFTLGSTNWKAL